VGLHCLPFVPGDPALPISPVNQALEPSHKFLSRVLLRNISHILEGCLWEIYSRSKSRACAIVILDNSRWSGTHWVAYNKNKNNIHYFDSFRNLQPPREVEILGSRLWYVQLWTHVPRFSTFFRRRCGVKTGIFKWLTYIWGGWKSMYGYVYVWTLYSIKSGPARLEIHCLCFYFTSNVVTRQEFLIILNKTRKNAIVEYLDYQIPVSQLNRDMQVAKRD